MYEKLYGLERLLFVGQMHMTKTSHIGVQGFIATSLYKTLRSEVITMYVMEIDTRLHIC